MRDNADGTVWIETMRGKTEVYWEKDAEDGTARKEETGEG